MLDETLKLSTQCRHYKVQHFREKKTPSMYEQDFIAITL